ncbi:MAG: hypothetical protein HKN32_03955 [Flavobacteriales bacterium]|nr:hypothetical protein [Flavobacteriales bacterium]
MIDKALLTKISGEDESFKKEIENKIYSKTVEFGKSFRQAAIAGEWNSCYYQLLEFYKSITPFARMSYLNEMNQQISVISYTEDEQVKRTTCIGVLKSLENQLSALKEPELDIVQTKVA